MPKNAYIEKYNFNEALRRIFELTKSNTQIELAERIGCKQSNISLAKSSKTIPGNWLLFLLHEYHANPMWILYGKENKYLVQSNNIINSQLIDNNIKLKNEILSLHKKIKLIKSILSDS